MDISSQDTQQASISFSGEWLCNPWHWQATVNDPNL
jgi:hypothetical protein